MTTEYSELLFLILLFVVATLYSSVGHGGASGYLALMGLFHFAPEQMRPAALLMNIGVSIMAFFQFRRSAVVKWNILIPLLLTSMPAAYFCSHIELDVFVYKKILAFSLLVPVFHLLSGKMTEPPSLKRSSIILSLFIGAILGSVSGLIGIGGGIFLSPLLLYLSWSSMRETAAISALFIFFNSTAGMFGLMQSGFTPPLSMFIWISVAFLGGTLGSYLGSKKITTPWLKKLLGVGLLLASLKLLTERHD